MGNTTEQPVQSYHSDSNESSVTDSISSTFPVYCSVNENTLSSSDNDEAKIPSKRTKVGLRDRIACYEWTFFTMTMATGGMSNIIFKIPYHSTWITVIGIAFFLFNLFLFVLNCLLLSLRFRFKPGSFTASFTNPNEALYIPSVLVSIALILINICEYGVPSAGVWLLHTLEMCFWVYMGIGIIASAGMYLIIWSTCAFPIQTMTPTWVFPAYPLLLTAPLAANMIDAAMLSGHHLALNTTAMAFGASAAQGTGCLIALMISAAFIYRLMTQRLPHDMQRPGVFISIGPFGSTASGIVQLGNQANNMLPPHFLQAVHSADIIRVVCLLVGLWLWALAMWFFLVSMGCLAKYLRKGQRLPFRMSWWSFVFPNTALVTATQIMAKVFNSDGLRIFGTAFTVLLIAVWVVIFVLMLRCLRARTLLWPA